ncbi:MAG: tRNA (N(6)-L-threonylcarbamoyladenosine(37)-C(2))-methylthiotransferase MtaB [Methylococcaceae bacterium]|nr:tRNA (N(6)-L-threonylcarbamoyladenosine(37)-C(2))-methylthiotransferase MtaB [Methylococcaceae bacterium]
MRVNLKTLGCRLNEAELETWAQQFQAQGHRIVPDDDEADLIVLNSCAVTQDAVRKSRHLIRRTHRENPSAKLVVSGCYASLNPDEVRQALGVDLVVSNADKARLVEIARESLDWQTMPAFSAEPGEASLFSLGRQRAFVKVQDGCRYRCTFCIVTLARGEETSRSVAEIVEEINTLHSQGIQEFVLTGVHLGGWSKDAGLRLEHLVSAILERTEIPRLRIGSLEPWELTEAFFDVMRNPRLMPHLHLPLQSGSDSVLRRMARRGKSADYAELVARARSACPDLNITTDIIVGFPGESEEEWRESLEFIEAMAFGHIHIFGYSVRAGTKAAALPGQVPGPLKKIRTQQLHQLAEKHKRQTLARFVGREFPVLWEEGRPTREDGRRWFPGYTPNYLRVETLAEPGRELCRRIESARLIAVADSGDHLIAMAY